MRRNSCLVLLAALTVLVNMPLAAQTLNFRSIDVSGATATRARGINAKRDIVGIYHVGASFYGFLLSNGTLTTIEHPDGIAKSQAWGISSTGDIAGFYGDQNSDRIGFE